MTAPLTSLANRAGPALLICMAPTRSACSAKPQFQADPDGRGGWMYWFDSLPPGLNRDIPMIPPPGHGDISWCCLDHAADDKPNPSSLGQENPRPIQLETLRVSKGINALAFFLEPGKPLRILFIDRHPGSLVEQPHGLLQSLLLRPG